MTIQFCGNYTPAGRLASRRSGPFTCMQSWTANIARPSPSAVLSQATVIPHQLTSLVRAVITHLSTKVTVSLFAPYRVLRFYRAFIIFSIFCVNFYLFYFVLLCTNCHLTFFNFVVIIIELEKPNKISSNITTMSPLQDKITDKINK